MFTPDYYLQTRIEGLLHEFFGSKVAVKSIVLRKIGNLKIKALLTINTSNILRSLKKKNFLFYLIFFSTWVKRDGNDFYTEIWETFD